MIRATTEIVCYFLAIFMLGLALLFAGMTYINHTANIITDANGNRVETMR